MGRKYVKTGAMAAAALVGESRLFLLTFVMRAIRVALLFSLWRSIMAGRGEVGGMTLGTLLTYTLLAEVCADLFACRTWIESAFWDGTIVTQFLRPISVFGQFGAMMFGWAILNFGLFSLPLLLAAPLLGVNPLPVSGVAFGLFLVSLGLSVAVGLALEYLFASTAVLLQMHPYILTSLRAALTAVLTGAFLPFALMPWGIGNVLAWSPFGAQASAPLQIYIGTGEAGTLLLRQAFWAAALWLIAPWMWNRCRERMVSYGG